LLVWKGPSSAQSQEIVWAKLPEFRI